MNAPSSFYKQNLSHPDVVVISSYNRVDLLRGKLMSWLKKLLPSRIRTESTQKKGVLRDYGLNARDVVNLYRLELEKNLMVCLNATIITD